MISRFLTEVSTRFNPFSKPAKTARIFLSLLPPNARQEMKVDVKTLPMAVTEPVTLHLKFSMFFFATFSPLSNQLAANTFQHGRRRKTDEP